MTQSCWCCRASSPGKPKGRPSFWRGNVVFGRFVFFKSLVVLFVYSPVSMLCQCSPLRSFLKEIRTWRDQNFEYDPLSSVRASSWWLSYSKHCEEVHCLNQSPWKFTSFRQPYIRRRIVHKDSMKCKFLQTHQFDASFFWEASSPQKLLLAAGGIIKRPHGPRNSNTSTVFSVDSVGYKWHHLMWCRRGEKTLDLCGFVVG